MKQLKVILPEWLAGDLETAPDLQEIRLVTGTLPELRTSRGIHLGSRPVSQGDLDLILNRASRYSPWAMASAKQGYLTAPGGHRIGICGEVVEKDGAVAGFRHVTSLCIRVCREVPGAARSLKGEDSSVLILGAPGWGKTTLLRDLCKLLSEKNRICVVDERGELFPATLPRGNVDVLTGSRKAQGMELLIRTMAPDFVGVDEITAPEDTQAVVNAVGCGVRILATAHAGSLSEFEARPVYRDLITHRVFHTFVLLRRDKTFTIRREPQWN